MNCSCRLVPTGILALAVVGASFAFAQSQNPPSKPTKPATPSTRAPQNQDMPQLPPEMQEYMQACEAAGQPGPMHQRLQEGVGVWQGKSKMWMTPDMEPMEGTVTSTITPLFDGRYIKCEIKGESAMGPFNGGGVYGYDNVSEKFQSTWIDDHSTQIMFGTGELSSDGDTLTWQYTYNCPVTKKPMKMREVETRTGANTTRFEMFGTDIKTNKEYKMMEIDLERVGNAPATPGATRPSTTRPSSTAPGSGASPGMISDKKAEAGCALCSYHMPGAESCALAVKVDGKTYLVTGANHVNFHQFCGAAGPKPAVVTGKIVDGKFVASKFEVEGGAR